MTTAALKLDIQRLRIVPLPSAAAFDNFRCGEPEIDRGLTKCCEWHGCHRARVFCAYLNGDPELYGFYCLGQHAHEATAVAGFFERASDDTRNYVPFIYLNYLAVSEGWRRQKIGTILLLNALERCAVVIRNIGAYGIALNALNDDAAALYDRYGFRSKNPGSHRHPVDGLASTVSFGPVSRSSPIADSFSPSPHFARRGAEFDRRRFRGPQFCRRVTRAA